MRPLVVPCLLVLSLSTAGCQRKQRITSEEKLLFGQWVEIESPRYRGYILNADCTGRRAGSDPTDPGYAVEWRIIDPGVIEIKGFGEEGESAGFEAFDYTLSGEELSLRSDGGWTRYRRHSP